MHKGSTGTSMGSWIEYTSKKPPFRKLTKQERIAIKESKLAAAIRARADTLQNPMWWKD